MTRKFHPIKGKAGYARHKRHVEPVFGQMKVAQDAKRFRLRGEEQTTGEWALHTFCHNLRKLRMGPPDGGLKARPHPGPLAIRRVDNSTSNNNLVATTA